MEKMVIIEKTKKLILETAHAAAILFYAFALFVILVFHTVVPFFPVLFLFDFCSIIGYPLFLRYVLKRRWFECTKDKYTKIKYILLPNILMEIAVLLYYHRLAFHVINIAMGSNE